MNNSPTDGEGHDVASLDPTGVQEDLIEALQATGAWARVESIMTSLDD